MAQPVHLVESTAAHRSSALLDRLQKMQLLYGTLKTTNAALLSPQGLVVQAQLAVRLRKALVAGAGGSPGVHSCMGDTGI